LSTLHRMIVDNEVVVLSQEWHLRPNRGGGLVYRFSQAESKHIRLPAYETVALALCDGHMRLDEISNLVSQMLDLSGKEALRIIQKLLEKNEEYGPFMIPLAKAKEGFTRVNASHILRELAAYHPEPQKALRMQVPLSLLVIPSYKCQTDCIYCYSERPSLPHNTILPPARWVKVLTEAGEVGVDLITFSGGDPLTYPGIDQLLAVVSHYHMSFILPTKTLVTFHRAKQLAELISEYGEIQISVDSIDPDIAAIMTRVRDYADRAKTSIMNLRAAGLPVRTNTVVTPLNLSSLEELIRELHRLGVGRANITNYSRTYYRHDNSLFLNQTQIDALQKTVNRLKRELDWPELNCNAGIRDFRLSDSRSKESWENRAGCSGGFSSCVILPNGDVVLCEQVPHDKRFVVGNVKDQSLLEIWNSKELIDFIVPDRALFSDFACADCDEFDSCHRLHGRCFRDAFFNYGHVYAPSPNCPRADHGIRMS